MINLPSTQVSNRKTIINSAVILFFMLLFGFLPPFGSITQEGMKILGVFIGCIYAWTIGIIIWPSLLALLCVGFIGDNSIMSVFTDAMGNPTVHMVFISLMFCYAVEKSGLIELIAKFVISRKFARRGPWSLCFAFWLATCITSAVTVATTAITLLCWQMFYEVAERINIKKRSPYAIVVVVGIGMSSYLGGIIMPYNAFTQICFGVLNSMNTNIEINATAYLITMVILNIIGVCGLFLFAKYCLRIKVDYNIPEDLIKPEDLVMNRRHKITLCLLALLVLLLLLPYYMPSSWTITAFLTNLGFVGSFAIVLIIMSFCKDENNESMFDFVDTFRNGIPYGMICLVITALLVSNKLTAPSTGISQMITKMLNPIMSLNSAYLSMAILMVTGIILTNVINNIVCITLMVPVGVALVSNAHANPAVMISLFCLVLFQGIVMPSSAMFGAILHGNTEWLSSKGIYKYASLLELTLGLIIGFIGVPIANVIFNFFA